MKDYGTSNNSDTNVISEIFNEVTSNNQLISFQ